MLAIFLDIETTGLDPKIHSAIDIACCCVDLATDEVKGSYQTLIRPTTEQWEVRDLVSMQINGYKWEQLQEGKPLRDVRREIKEHFTTWGFQRGKGIFVCQNPAFDRGFFSQIVDVYLQEQLNWPYHWLDLASMFFAHRVSRQEKFPPSLKISKDDIAKHFGLSPEPRPHKAMNGTKHLMQCYNAVVRN
ncbi:MAG: 3'-5' exonuclease [Chlamydiia bacterium]|nr:3'-5' exonuclease [Chlamydiia bacterium]